MIKKHHYISFILICTYIAILSPKLFSDGMFMDGLWYSVIGRNLSEGIGSFWLPKFTETVYNPFYEHPPLAFGLQSILFSIFGDHILVERFYSLLTFITCVVILLKFFQNITKNGKWIFLPLALLVSIPLVKWCTENNMLENTMSVFTLASVYFQYKSLKEKQFFNIFLAGLSILLAFLSKGFTGLFVFSFFFWCAILDIKNWRDYFLKMIYLMAFFLVSLGLMLVIFPESQDFLVNYFNKQVIGSIANIATVDSRFYILKRCLLEELIAPIIITAMVFYFNREKIDLLKSSKEVKLGLIFLLVGLNGVLPIMISMKQRGFYIMATFPIFALGFSLIIYPLVGQISFDKIENKLLQTFSILSFIVMISLAIKSTFEIRRNKDLVNDTRLIGEVVGRSKIIGIHKSLSNQYSLMGYFMRYDFISLDFHSTNYEYYISSDDCSDQEIKKSLTEIPLKTLKFKLYKK